MVEALSNTVPAGWIALVTKKAYMKEKMIATRKWY